MPEQPKQRDILADILADSHHGAIRGLEELGQLIRPPEASRPLTKKAATAASPPTRGRRGPRHKTTHYLATEVFETLGDAKEGVKELLPAEARFMATKSRIVESAVAMVLKDFEAKGKDSALIQELLKEEGLKK
ncbi:MAG: hypothetical protein M0T76_00830 [Desulfobacteraceae bacterium]|nr:hypothetical protein [Desulfobacteraceae bacterium]